MTRWLLLGSLVVLTACATPLHCSEPPLLMPTWPDLAWMHGKTQAGETLRCLTDTEAVKLGRYRLEMETVERARGAFVK